MKKDIIINNQIIKDLSQNSVQNNNDEFIFGYDKILDEKGFYKKDGSLDINKILIYKESLKYEYLNLLDKVYWYKIGVGKYGKNSFSSNFNSFLKVKNELKYICDLLEKTEYIKIFNFWFEFNKKGFDENDKFWYENRKNVDEVDWKDIYNYIDSYTLKQIKKINNLELYKDFVLIDYELGKSEIILSLKDNIFHNLKDIFTNFKETEFYEGYILKDLLKINEFKEYILENIFDLFYRKRLDFYEDNYLLEEIIIDEEISDRVLIFFKKEISKGLLGENKEIVLSFLDVILKKKYSISKIYKLFGKKLIGWGSILNTEIVKIENINKENINKEKVKLNIEYTIKRINRRIIYDEKKFKLKYFYQGIGNIFLNKKNLYLNKDKDFIKLLNGISENIKTDFYEGYFIRNISNLFYKISKDRILLNALFKNFKKELEYIYESNFVNKSLKTRLFTNLMKGKEAREYFKESIFNSKNYHQQKISSFIKNSDSGSFLLSGYRGVGKTSLLQKTFSEFNTNKEEKVIPVFVNIPEPDENNKFSKKQLMNFIIRNLYKQVLLNPGKFPKKFERKLEDQYIRTFKDVKNIEGELVVRKRGVFRYILAILQYGLPFGFGLLIFIFGENIFEFIKNIFGEEYKIIFENLYKNFALIQLITAFVVFIIGFKISFSFINVTFKSQIAQDLYDENIAEQKLTDNLGNYNNYLNTFWFKIGNRIFVETYNFLEDKLNKIFLTIFFFPIFFIIFIVLIGLLGIIIYALLLIIESILVSIPCIGNIFSWIFNLYPYGIYGFTFLTIFFYFFLKISIILLKKYFSRPKYKFVIVIDELDKLLDFDKNIEGNKKKRLDMASIFDILGKLKILFFDTKGLLFFVVSNKESYDYHLKNKYREDDLVSNIFNRILYLPMNEKEKFNLNFSVLGLENEEFKKEDVKIKNIEKTKLINPENNFSKKELNDFNNWLYFKSHGNWRKMRFILNNKLDDNGENNVLKIDLDKIDFENKFYEFFNKIYYLSEEDLYSLEQDSVINEILIGGEGDKKGILIDFLEGDFYKNYLGNLENIGNDIFGKDNSGKNNFSKNNIKVILDNLKINIGNTTNNNIGNTINNNILFKNIGFFISSISKISEEKSFRDYVLNNLLNFYEALNFYKKIDFQILFEKIKIDKNDLDYPAFEDFILYWLPFMLYYFGKKELINKDELENLFSFKEEEKDKKKNTNSLSTDGFNLLSKNNILKIYSQKEDNLLIDIYLKQSVDNLNSEGGFNLKFYEIKNNDIKNNDIWRKFIKTKLGIAFGKIKKSNEIDKVVFEFWRKKIIGKFLENKCYYNLQDILTRKSFFSYYSYNYKKRFNEHLKQDTFEILKEGNNIFKYEIIFELLLIKNFELLGFKNFENISEKYSFKINKNFGLTESQMEDEAIGVEGIDYPEGGWEGFNNKEDIMKINSISYSKINPLDDIKVIKEEWFNTK